jgi:uncharacterized RDD family membrane protein YckC
VAVVRRDNSTVLLETALPQSPPSIFRRLASIVYDMVALAAIWFFATLAVVIVRKGEAVTPGNPSFIVYLLVTAYAYFGFCWTHTGQTLGMKSWKIALVATGRDRPVGWTLAAIRFGVAIVSWGALGLGFLWAVFDPDRRTWHDRISRSHLRSV